MLKANSDRGDSLRNSYFNVPHFNTIKYGKHSLRYLMALSSGRNLQRNYVLRIVCADLRLKSGEQT